MRAGACCLLAVLAFGLSVETSSAQQLPGESGQLRVVYCRPGQERSDWERNGILAVGRVAMLPDWKIGIAVQTRECSPEMPDASCFAALGILACRSAAIERTLRASALLLARWLARGAPSYEEFWRGDEKAVLETFRQADGAPVPEDVEALAERMRLADAASDDQALSDEDAVLGEMYRYLADRALAVVVGHELSHVNGDQCPIAEPALKEGDLAWKEALNSHIKRELFCDRPITPAEATADRCALRFLHASNSTEDAVDASAHGAALRRLAADIVAYIGLFGLRAQSGGGPLIPAALPGYLHVPFRSLLFAGEANGAGPGPAVCGTAAQVFVQATQWTFTDCSGGGIVSDRLLAELPKGVEASWNGAPWTPDAYSCE